MKTRRHIASNLPEPCNKKVVKIVRSTVCDDLGLSDGTRCDGCVRRQGKPESQYSARQYLCKRYFAPHFSREDDTKKRGTSQAVASCRKTWEELIKLGYTKPADENQFLQPHPSTPGKKSAKSRPPPLAVKKTRSRPPDAKTKSALPSTKSKTRLQSIEWLLNTKANSEIAKLIDSLCNAVDSLVLHLDKNFDTAKVHHSAIPNSLIALTKLPQSIDLTNLPNSPPQPQTPTPVTNVADTTAAVEAMVQLAAGAPPPPPPPPPEVIDLSEMEPAVHLHAAPKLHHATRLASSSGNLAIAARIPTIF
jgi:hypothetical protein